MADIIKHVIRFPNQRTAFAVSATPDTAPDDLIAALELEPPRALILSIGGAATLQEDVLPKLAQLYGRGIARAAAEANALVIDGGTQAGVMSLMGEGIAAHNYRSTLVGVAPAAKVSYEGSPHADGVPLEPNHSHFALVDGEDWGSETPVMFRLLASLSSLQKEGNNSETKSGRIPSVVILSGGGDISKIEVLQAVRQKLPIIIVTGSGGLADEIAAACEQKDAGSNDPVIGEIIADGELQFHSIQQSVKGIERLIIRKLGNDKVLLQAWETFATYDHNANRQQAQFERLQKAIVILSVVSVALVIIQQVFAPRETSGDLKEAKLANVGFGWWALHHLLILLPVLFTILVTAANRFRNGNKWLLLRAGAEAIKREIYRYRTKACAYTNNSEQRLAKTVEEITRRTMRTEVNLSALAPYHKSAGFPPYMSATDGGDDGFSFLTPDRYVTFRLDDQLRYFQRKTVRMEKQLVWLYWLMFIIGGIGTYLAAIGMQAWVALSTSIVAALGTFLGYRQTESTLTKYNQAATDLTNVKAWWDSLSAEEQSQQVNIDSLVSHTERVLQSELTGWVQQMQNALADLRKGQEQTESAEKEKTAEEGETVPARKTAPVSSELQEEQPVVSEKETVEEEANHSTKVTTASEPIKAVGQFE